jgi:membrane associated rhomboid family serine protease
MSTSSYKKRSKILLGQDNNSLVLLFAANMIIFVSLHILSMIYQLSGIPMDLFESQVLNWFSLPAIPDVLATRPWTVLLHMFTHYGFWHLVSSMLWLWFFGYNLQDLAGNNRLIPVYLYGGLTGALVFVLASNFIPGLPSSPVMGASAAVMAVAIAITTLTPGFRFFPLINGGIPLWVITLIFVAIDFSTLGKGNTAMALSHLSAGMIGFLFTWQLKRGNDWGAWMNRFVDWLNGLFNPEKKHSATSGKERLHYQSTRQPFEKRSKITQQKLDAILEKIHLHGYDQLTEEEKEFLQRASKEEL